MSENETSTIKTPSKWSKKSENVKNLTLETTEKSPYTNYSGEYGKDFNHYMKMGLNESDTQQSVHKLLEMEIKKAKEDYDGTIIDDSDGYIFVDVAGNEIEPLKHPQYVTDHHSVSHHDENIAMVTVGCVVFGMCIFLILMIYILRKQQPRDRDVEEIDPQFATKKAKLPPSKIVHEPLPSLYFFIVFVPYNKLHLLKTIYFQFHHSVQRSKSTDLLHSTTR